MRFLLGPAGSGKTFRCLAEIRAALRAAPEGPPLVMLAPKQATFQIERQLLAVGESPGYTRLHILSFDRLAQFVLDAPGAPLPARWLNEEGRTMVLRALLARHAGELRLFGLSARRPGFAGQLSGMLDELQRHHGTPAKLRRLAQNTGLDGELRNKLYDLALLLEAYVHWLDRHELQDSHRPLDAAAEMLRQSARAPGAGPLIENLWLDGFAEMTPQEMDLLAGILPHCHRATLAFCLDETAAAEASWLSQWSPVGKTVEQCRRRIAELPEMAISVEWLRRNPPTGRFAGSPDLQQLEREWPQPSGDRRSITQKAVRLAACADADGEATLAAREVRRFVRAGGRFRDCAVLVRNLESHYPSLTRVFRRYEVPFFLDRRECMAHHPLAELTRSAFRTVVFDWRPDDWFAALKTGFVLAGSGGEVEALENQIDRLENAALEFGWRGRRWLAPLSIPGDPELEKFAERLRQRIVPPFEQFTERLLKPEPRPTGSRLAEAIQELWHELDVEGILEQWSRPEPEGLPPLTRHPSLHSTVWDQMNAWLDNIVLAFPDEALSLRDWLPVLEAGLAGLTVGVVPPALDQVLVGAVDRARNPDLKLALVLGVNESLFPAAPATPAILTDADRAELGQTALSLGPGLRERLARERFLGYIACTRASERLVVTFARQGTDGKALNPSPFVAHLRRILPGLEVEEFRGVTESNQVESANELIDPLVKVLGVPAAAAGKWRELLELPRLAELAKDLRALREPDLAEGLSPAMAGRLWGPMLRSSVSRLEEFAQCPFRFFVHSGLHADERKVFELDAREQGSFQHEVLKVFHDQLKDQNKRWRDLTPAEAREQVGRIAAERAQNYRDGLLRSDEKSRFTARVLTESLQNFAETLVAWMREQYEFDPAAAEIDFGMDPNGAPAWELDLGEGHRLALRGRIDRIDLCADTGDRAWCVVMDYKSSRRKLDAVLMAHGVQLQLLAYLAAVSHWPDSRALTKARLIPAGAFYVNLRGEYERGSTRDEALADPAAARRRAYRHAGRFDMRALPQLDRTRAADQFNYRLNKDGKLWSKSTEALPRPEFEKLLAGVETQLREIGRAIFSGAMPVAPYRKGRETPCEFCDYRAACRMDPWTHRYRVLRAEDQSAASSG